MKVKIILKALVEKMDMVNQRSEIENEVIQYGLELILETIVKLIFLLMLGFLIGKGVESLIILMTFCGLRSFAGGRHANTNIGCTLCMIFVWGISLIGYLYFDVSDMLLGYIYIISSGVIAFRAPQTSNIKHFTKKKILKMKVKAISLLTLFIFVGYLKANIRGLLVYPVILEVITLLPVNKINERGKVLYEREISFKNPGKGD